MAFRGWPAEALEFFEGLQADNSKTYWTANKATYDETVRGPMVALIEDLEPEFGTAKIYRPYRDVRFSKDKAPYKTQIAASFERGGYVRLSAEGLGAGSGIYMFSPEQVKRWRESVADDGSGRLLVETLGELRRQGIETSSHDVLTRVPTGFPKDHPRAELLRYKDLVGWRDWPVAPWLGTAKAKTRLEEFFRTCHPLNDWLHKHVA
jgi:uncharacterized protein (TIGR02453 family)